MFEKEAKKRSLKKKEEIEEKEAEWVTSWLFIHIKFLISKDSLSVSL